MAASSVRRITSDNVCYTKLLRFAGDSGNDLPVRGSDVRSVLVANASDEVKLQARQLASQSGHADALYLAQEGINPFGGNYAAGVLQGIQHFFPELCRSVLEERL